MEIGNRPLHERFTERFYGPDATRNEEGGTISSAVASYTQRRAAKFVDDAERLAQVRAEGVRIRGWAERHGISPKDLQTALAVQLEREQAHERQEWDRIKERNLTAQERQDAEAARKATLEARVAATREALRLECGSQEEADARLQRYVGLTATLAQELPELATRANENGAGVDIRVVRALDHYDPVPAAAK